MKNRNVDEIVAATKVTTGSDVNFGNLTCSLFSHLCSLPHVELRLGYEVRDLEKTKHDQLKMKIKHLDSSDKFYEEADFVFLEAGEQTCPC